MFLFNVLYPGATHLNYLDFLCLLGHYPRVDSVSSYFSDFCKYWNIQNALASSLWYSGLGVVGEYHGGACSIRSKSFSNSKNRIFRAALCLVRYLVGTSALHPDVMCATLSG